MTLRPTLTAAAVGALALSALAGSAAAQNTTKSSSTNSCPSAQSVMTSNWYGSTKGYLCAFEYHDGNRSIGEGSSQTFNQDVNVAYFPQYYCWDSSDSKDIGYSHMEIFGSGSVTATNWGTGSHVWGAGYLYTLGSGSVTGWSSSCYDNANVWQQTPSILTLSSITASGLPNNGTSPAGGAGYSVSVSVAPGSQAAGAQVVLQDNGVNVAGGVLSSTGTATLKWVPAEMGSRTIQVAWPGNSTMLGNITDKYTVNVQGGTAVSVTPDASGNPVTVSSTTGGVASITMDVSTAPDTFPTGATLTVVDVSTGTPTGLAKPVTLVPAAGATSVSTAVAFGYTPGKQYKLMGIVKDAAGNPVGQSYVIPFSSTAPTLAITGWTNNASTSQATATVTTTNIVNGQTVTILKNGTAAGTGIVSQGKTTISYSQSGGTSATAQATYVVNGATFASAQTSYYANPCGGVTNCFQQPGERVRSSQPATRAVATERGGIARPQSPGPADTGALSVSRSTKITSSRRGVTLNCRKGYFPLHGEGATSGPDTEIGVTFSGRKAKFQSSAANVGYRMYAQLNCRANSASAAIVDGKGYGTRGSDDLATAVPSGTIFAGPGHDRIHVTGRNSSAWGGVGNDRMRVGGRDSVGAGGPGRDRIIAVGPGRKLLWGGAGRDLLVGGPGPTLINAADGKGGDRIICRSSSNRVMIDAGDTTKGPCTVISTN